MDFGGQGVGERVWGWSSVNDPAIGFAGKNVGIWHVLASVEMYNGGPLKTELMEGESAYTLNMINGSHYGLGQAFVMANNEVWSKTYGPYFVYFNNVASTLTDAVQASRALFADAQAQAMAEQAAWPYTWFNNANYVPASGRGAITGQMVINDTYNPNASASNLWVGIVQQPAVSDGVYDFQEWCKAYEFWTKSDANGNFTITNVVPGNNYTLYAFGPGAAGTFMSQNSKQQQRRTGCLICQRRRSASPSPAGQRTIWAVSPGRRHASGRRFLKSAIPTGRAASFGTGMTGSRATSVPARPRPAPSGPSSGLSIRLSERTDLCGGAKSLEHGLEFHPAGGYR